jgi:CDP-diacylglycerol--glycerol-3-phosphate 3-phosphatidyltransferase
MVGRVSEKQQPFENASVTGDSDGSTFVSNRLLTIPNVLCTIRLVGAPFLMVLAIGGRSFAFVCWYLFLTLTDWIDGKLAIWLNQRSVIGARLDSWADATMYASLLAGGLWLKGDVAIEEIGWIGAASASYAATTIFGLRKFGRWPSYHTRAAKTSWLLVTIGAVCLLTDLSLWPFRIAMVAVTLTNLEAILITRVLSQWHADVPSLAAARKIAQP